MKHMTPLQELHYRLDHCRAGTGEGWGEKRSLRNHLQCSIDRRLGELRPFVEEIKALPATDSLRKDNIVVELLGEYHDLEIAKREAEDFLGVAAAEPKTAQPQESPADRTEGVKRCLRNLGIPS